MALRFFEPITAPQPDPPAAHPLSQIMHAERTLFSPAGPIDATLIRSSPNFSRISFSVSQVVFPQINDASFISILSSCIQI